MPSIPTISLPMTDRHRGFTLVEMLTVVVVIVVLVAIVLVVGRRAVDGGRTSATQGVIRVLELSLDQYTMTKGELPRASVTVRTDDDTWTIPIIDGRVWADGTNSWDNDSVGLYILQCSLVPEAASELKGIDDRFLKQFDRRFSGADKIGGYDAPDLTVLTDAWGQPIRYVHPELDGPIYDGYPDPVKPDPTKKHGSIEIADALGEAPAASPYPFVRMRRNMFIDPLNAEYGDSDGGTCIGGRPYFYSVGLDKNPALTEDNIYSNEPSLPRVEAGS